jgi:hypothetical protein
LSVAGHDTEWLHEEEGSAEDLGGLHNEYVLGSANGMRGIGAGAGEHAVLGHHAVRTAASGLDFYGEVYQDDHDAVSGWANHQNQQRPVLVSYR